MPKKTWKNTFTDPFISIALSNIGQNFVGIDDIRFQNRKTKKRLGHFFVGKKAGRVLPFLS